MSTETSKPIAKGSRSLGVLLALIAAWGLSGLNLYLSWKSSTVKDRVDSSTAGGASRFTGLSGVDLRSRSRVELESHFSSQWRDKVSAAKKEHQDATQQSPQGGSVVTPQLSFSSNSTLMFSHSHYPAWVHGHWLLVQHQHHGQQKVINLLHKYMFELHIPVTTVVLDAHWADPTDMFRWDSSLYPHPDQFLTILEQEYNVRVVLWLSSLVPVRDKRYEMFKKNGLFLQNRPPGHLGEKHCKPSGASGFSAEVDTALRCPPERFIWKHGDSPQTIEGSLLDMHLGSDLLPHHNGSLELRPSILKMEKETPSGEQQDFFRGKNTAVMLYKTWYDEMVDFLVKYGVDGVRAGAVDSLLLGERHLYSAWGASSTIVKARHREPLMKEEKKSAEEGEDRGAKTVEQLEEAKENVAAKERGHKVTREPYAEEYYHQMHLASVLSHARRSAELQQQQARPADDSLTALQVDGGVLFARTIDTIAGQRYTHFAPQDVAVAGFSGEQSFSWHGYKETMMHIYQCAYNQYINCGSVIGGTLSMSEDEKQDHVNSHIDPGEYEYLKRNNKHVKERVEAEKRKYFLKEHDSKKAELVRRWTQTTSWLPIFASSTTLVDFLSNSSTPSSVPRSLSRAALLHSTFTPFWLALSTSAFNNQLEVAHREHHLEDPEHFGNIELEIWKGETKDENQKYADFRKERQKHVEGYLGADLFNDRKAAANVDGFLKSHEMDHRGMSIRPTARDGRIFYDEPLDWSYSLGVGLNQDDVFVVPIVSNSFGGKRTKVAVTLPHLRHQIEAHVDPEDVAQAGLNHPHHKNRHFRASEWVHIKHRQLLPSTRVPSSSQKKKGYDDLDAGLEYIQAGEQVILLGDEETLEESDAVFFRRGALIPRLFTSAILDAYLGVRNLEAADGTVDALKTRRPIALFNPYTTSGGESTKLHHHQWRYLVMESYLPVQGQREVFSSPFAANWFEGFEASVYLGGPPRDQSGGGASLSVLSFEWTSALAPTETLVHSTQEKRQETDVVLLDHSRVFLARSAEIGPLSHHAKIIGYEITCSLMEETASGHSVPILSTSCLKVNSSVLSSQLSAVEPLQLLLEGNSEPSLAPKCWFSIPKTTSERMMVHLVDLLLEMPPVLSTQSNSGSSSTKASDKLAVSQQVQCSTSLLY